MFLYFRSFLLLLAITAFSSSAFMGRANAQSALAEERVHFTNADPENSQNIEARLFRPKGDGPFPAVITLHGCGGSLNQKGEINARHVDWTARLVGNGYVVIIPDSFASRSLGSQCDVKERKVRVSRERAYDTLAARDFLRAQSYIKPDSISMLGWSNGASTVLWTGGRTTPPGLARAIALYPGCKSVLEAAEKGRWHLRQPTLILIGEADNWTPAEPCKQLVKFAESQGTSLELVLYPGAYHNFDWPNMPIRNRSGVAYSADGSGNVTVGTDLVAREDAIRRVLAFLPK